MNSLKQAKGEPVHHRSITISTHECAEGGIIVEGELKDNRLKTYYKISGEPALPGMVHHMILRMHVTGPPLTIKDIEAEMPGVPRDECRETINSLNIVKGMSITPGFTLKIKTILGGPVGCSHLTALLLAMAPAVVQGSWAYHAQKPLPDEFSPDLMNQYLIDTCRVWRREGDLAKSLLQQAKGK
jgi:hypothetical protein